MNRGKELAEALAIVSVLVILGIYLIVQGIEFRQLLGAIIMAPSIILAIYYAISSETDKYYGLGLYTVIALLGLFIYGLANARIIAGIILLIIASLVLLSYLRRKEQTI